MTKQKCMRERERRGEREQETCKKDPEENTQRRKQTTMTTTNQVCATKKIQAGEKPIIIMIMIMMVVFKGLSLKALSTLQDHEGGGGEEVTKQLHECFSLGKRERGICVGKKKSQ